MSAQPNITDQGTLSAGSIHPESPKTKKKLIRRTDADRSQQLRRYFQIAFLVLNAYVGVLFYMWVRHFESAGATRFVERPAGVEGWLPIAALMNLKYLVLTGHVPSIHPAGMFLLVAFLGISLVFRKSFCSWLCPIGTISEYLWKLGRRTFRRNFSLPRWADIPLRGLKYLLLGFFVYVIGAMSVEAIAEFLSAPYGLIADVKMLNFFRFMSTTAAVVVGVIIVLSFFVQNFWCRYLCPYGALMGLAALFSPARIHRNAEPCIDCGKCAKACPSQLPVDKLVQIRSAECTACLECVAVCPAEGALQIAVGVPLIAPKPQRRLSPVALAAGIALVFLGLVGFAKTAGYWDTDIPRDLYMQLVPSANQASHPGL
ncbi:MAG TPA: 4Fe-4S binding protein [Clostridia bacterium]|nr:4Fe-4S binding protein [Clostridia bacterium]